MTIQKPGRTVIATLLAAAAVFAAAAAVLMKRAEAEGIPSAPALHYSGTLVENGVPVSAVKNMGVSLWTAESAGSMVCERMRAPVEVQAGRFRIALDACLTGVRANQNLWVQVDVDGSSSSLPRRKLGAVPYAVEAERASQLSATLAAQLVPGGAVLAFDLDACPPGWAEMTSAQGRTIIGTRPEAAPGQSRLRGQTGGAETVTLTQAQLPAHSHPVTDPGHTHPPHGATFIGGGAADFGPANVATTGASFALSSRTGAAMTGVMIGNTGEGQSVGIMPPYLALLYCRKM
jgi:hypothetical protein